MNRVPLNIGAIHLTLSENVLQKLHEKKLRFPHLPEPNTIVHDFLILSGQNGVPAAIRKQEGGDVLLLYTSSYCLGVYPSNQNDGYRVAYVDVLNLREHERLRKGVLLLKATSWNMYQTLNQIPPGNSNYWGQVCEAWGLLERLIQQAKRDIQQTDVQLTSEHENYLNTISTLIDVTRKLEQDKNKLPTRIPYKGFVSIGEERHALHDMYSFYLSSSPKVNEKSMLRLKEAPDIRGNVFALENNLLTVKFAGSIDRVRIPNEGNFEPIMNEVVFRTQQQAVEMLRDGEAKNVHLLNVLVDQKYQPYHVYPVMPKEPLNSEQVEAFQRALTVPDILLVLGPPGTGKTRTITEIAQQCGMKHQRVLITSKTHKAVDNVLERLPDTLTVIRFGHEDRVAGNMRYKLIDEQASDLQRVVLQQTTARHENFTKFMNDKKTNEQLVGKLTLLLTHLSEQYRQAEQVRQQRAQVMQRIGTPYEPKLNKLARSLEAQYDALNRHSNKLSAFTQKQTNAQGRVDMPLLGFIFTWLVMYYQRRIGMTQENIMIARNTYTEILTAQTQLKEEIQRSFWADPEYRWCEESLQRIEQNTLQLQNNASTIATTLQKTIYDLVPTSPSLNRLTIQVLHQYVEWYNTTCEYLERQAILMQDWRTELASRTDQLYPELLRYADVVGATCIGVASIKGLNDIEFDLVVVDEAGQICLPDLLVPLVRTKRAVLVGDHHQLPPFIDREVQTWLDSISPQTQQVLGVNEPEIDSENITTLLTKSTFEQLFTSGADTAHLARFTQQGRMPRVIADFVSRQFYEDRLGTFTPDNASQPDPLFRRALAFVDTSFLSFKERKETEANASENWLESGYINRCEAMLITDIAAAYEREGSEWVVIVPYRAQADFIVQQLHARLGVIDFKLQDRVSTVDSFQGGEKNKVIYGFTRSNTHGGVGFLKELRRLNVAMTRAKQQLVMVGDTSTLINASDGGFRRMAIALRDYVRQHGELLSYTECQERL